MRLLIAMPPVGVAAWSLWVLKREGFWPGAYSVRVFAASVAGSGSVSSALEGRWFRAVLAALIGVLLLAWHWSQPARDARRTIDSGGSSER